MTAPDIKILYFDHRIRAEPSRLLLAYGNLDYKDERLPVPWDNTTAWTYIKPNMSWGQLPVLTWNGVQIGQSITIARFIAREIGISGNNNLEMAQVDEIIDAIQDAITAMYNAWFSDNRKEELIKIRDQTYPFVLTQMEARLSERKRNFLVGNNITWADIHLFLFCSRDFIEPDVVAEYPKVAELVGRVGAVPSIKNYMETRPPLGQENKDLLALYKNIYKILEAEALAVTEKEQEQKTERKYWKSVRNVGRMMTMRRPHTSFMEFFKKQEASKP